jgi:hypothetical protein
LAVILLRSAKTGIGAFLALGVVAVFVAFVTWPLAGRSAEQWTPVVATHLARRSGLRRRGALAGLELGEIPGADPGGRIGLVVDKAARTWTAAVRVGGSGFALGDDLERSRRIAAWSGVLAASAREGGGIHRLAWMARSVPASLAGPVPRAGPDRGIAAESYASLLEKAVPLLWNHEILVTLTTRTAAPPAGRKGEEAARRLREELAALERRCLGAGLEWGGVLSPGSLAAVIRSASAVSGAVEGPSQTWPWPVGIEERWSSLRTDGTWHAVYWIADWPRTGVGTGFLLPMMLEGGLRRTIAVTMAPVAPLRAVRRAEQDRTSGVADAELRQRHGFAVTARARHEQEATTRRESELAEGHSAFRFTGYLAVTADDEPSLARACSRLEQIAAQAQLELHRMYGAQQNGFSCLLPTGRGCA